MAHHSQFGDYEGAGETPLNRPGFIPPSKPGLAYGHRIGARYGEAFRLFKPLAASDPADLARG